MYKNSQTKPSAPTAQPATYSTTQPSPSPTNETANPDSIGANWKTYTNTNYTFQHPSDWETKKFDYLNTTQILNKSRSIQINISEGQYPYGYESSDNKFEEQYLTVNINGQNYQVKETTVNNKEVVVDFQIGKSKYHILFGTGYPAGEDKLASISEYNSMKETILKILSTFKFQ